jgi:predicted MPP superfamily phosphohydrolase
MKKKIRRAILLVIVALSIWSFGIEPNRLVVHRETIAIPLWGARAPMTIAIAGDLHVGSPWCGIGKLREVVRTLNGAHADMIVLLGDYVIQDVIGGRFVDPVAIANELRALHAPLGVYAVIGNHDNWLDGSRVTAALRGANIDVLNDESRSFEQFTLAGVTDLWTGAHDVNKTLAQIGNDGKPVILITHNPDLFVKIPPRVSLMLAAHTHGGQVNLPLVGRLIVPSKYGQRFAAGHIVENGRHLFVTTGVGTSIIPVRFRVPPEVVVLRVTSSRTSPPAPAAAASLR